MNLASPLARQLALLGRQSGRTPAAASAAYAACAPEPAAPLPGGEVAPAAAHDARPVAEQLQRLASRAHALPRPGDDEIARRLGGQVRSEGLIEIEHRHPLAGQHGQCALSGLAAPDLCWLTGGEPAGPVPDLLFIDTETTGLAGGSGTLAFLVGIARVRGDALVITQWLITRFAAEAAMLAALAAQVGGQRSVPPPRPVEWVSYNGKSFDLPLLATRFRLARLPAGIDSLAHHDLLHPVRTAFGRLWPDCRLQTVEQRLLGVHRNDDLPGSRIPAVWADFVQFGEARELAALVEHNRIDLLSLAALLPVLSRIYLEPSAAAIREGTTGGTAGQAGDAAAIARMQLRRRRAASARAHLCAGEAQLDARARLDLAALHRAQRDWPAALRIWHDLAGGGSPAALEALAKYHEHVSRDLREALRWCEALCHADPGSAAHVRRGQRLLARQQRANASAGSAAPAADLFAAAQDRPPR